jgi:hypothetical protein
MDVGQVVDACRIHLREPTRFDAQKWRVLMNAAQMEMQGQTHLLEGEFTIILEEGVRAYDISAHGLYRLTQDPCFLDDGSVLPRYERNRLAGSNLEETGTPDKVYIVGTGLLGFYPVPNAAMAGRTVLLYGKRWPAEITATTPDSFVPEFEAIDHPTLVLGTVMQAERIDTDINISQLVRAQYADGIGSMRSRQNNRLGSAGVVRVSGR